MNPLNLVMVLPTPTRRAGHFIMRKQTRYWAFALQSIAMMVAPLPPARAQPANNDTTRGQALEAAGDYRGALDAFTKAIARAPGDSQAYYGQGMARINLKDYAGAIQDFDQVVAANPTNAIAFNERGFAKMNSGDQKGALADYAQCIQLDPTYVPVRTNRGILYRSAGNAPAAMRDYNQALQIAPKNERARVERAALELAMGNAMGAREDLNVVVENDPKNANAYYNRGQALEELGDRAGAVADYQKALAIKPAMVAAKNRVTALQASVAAAAASVRSPGAATATAVQTQPPQAPAASGPSKGSAATTVVTVPSVQPGKSTASSVTTGEVVALAQPPPEGSPALPMPANLDINLVSGTQFAGEVAAAKEAMSAIQGPLSADDQKKFEAKWAPFFNFPALETAEYFKKLNPLLQEYLHLRASIPGITTEMAAAWREAVMLAGYNNEAAVRESLGEARVQEQLLQGVNGRMAEIMRQVQALGDPPDATQAKARTRKHHDDAVALVKKVLPTFTLGPASQSNAPGTSCSFTPQATNLPAGAVIKWDFGDGKGADSPVQPMQHAYAKEGSFSVTAQLLDGATRAVIATATVAAKISTQAAAAGPGVWVLQKADRQLPAPSQLKSTSKFDQHGDFKDYRRFDRSIVDAFSPNSVQSQLKVKYVEYDNNGDLSLNYEMEADVSASYDPLPKTLNAGDPLRLSSGYSITENASSAAALDYCSDYASSATGYATYFWTSLSTLTPLQAGPPRNYGDRMGNEDVISLLGIRTGDNMDINKIGTRTARAETETKHFVPAGSLGQTWKVRFQLQGVSLTNNSPLFMTEDYTYVFQPAGTQPAEVAVNEQSAADSANQQRISELQNDVNFIDESISRLQSQRNSARDLTTQQSIDYQIIQAQTDRLAELDLIASLKSGQDVHTRSPFDDYAHQSFVANIREQQLKTQESQREAAALFKFVEIGDDPDGMRDQIQRDLVASGAIARGDIAAIRKMANALNNRVIGYWQGQQARSQEAAIDAEENIFICNSILTASTMLLSGGMSQLGAVYTAPSWVGTVGTMTYAGATGYIASGSPGEALKQTLAWSCTVGQVATSMYDGYQDGGGWSGAMIGGGSGLAVGWLTGKVSEAVIAKWGTGPAFTRPPLRERPPTVGDFINSAEFRQAQAAGKAKVKAFEDAQTQLQAAGQSGAPAERIKELQDAVMAHANEINADQHAKMFLLKSGQSNPASIRAYESYHRAIHADVEARFHEIMENEMGFNHQEVAPVRNATSTGSAGMGYDLALKEGNPITRNGKQSNVSEWQQQAKEAYNRAFQQSTGHSAEEAWENVTSSVHVESYKDIGNNPGQFEGWLCDLRNPANVAKLKSKLAQQAADVTRVKAWEFQNNKTMGEFSKMQEICRGTAKDMKTKLDPVLAVAKTASLADEETLRQTRAYWKQVQEVMEDFGSNRIGPITAKQKLYQLTGKESIQEVIDQMGVTMQGAVQWGR